MYNYCIFIYSIRSDLLLNEITVALLSVKLQYEYNILIYRNNTVYYIQEYNYCIFIYSIRIDLLLLYIIRFFPIYCRK